MKSPQTVTVFGAAGPTGLLVCLTALAAGHRVRAVSRRDDPLPLPGSDRLVQVRADAVTGTGVENAVTGADAVLSTLGCAYQRSAVTVYSSGTQHIVEAMRRAGTGRRLVVVSSGLTYEPPKMNWFANTALFPLLRNVVGRTLYADMRRMEEALRDEPDIEWTVMRPGRLFNAPAPSAYRLDAEAPSQGWTARADLAAAMVAELQPGTAHPHQAVAPTTTRRGASSA
nr:NAD(P)H-binding protein [Kocuria sp. JC486]